MGSRRSGNKPTDGKGSKTQNIKNNITPLRSNVVKSYNDLCSEMSPRHFVILKNPNRNTKICFMNKAQTAHL